MDETEMRAVVDTYLEAFHRRALPACMAFFTEDAKIPFAMGTYEGTEAIEQWHSDRFAADFRVLRVERVKIRGETVVVDAVGTSKMARAWRFNEVSGRATFSLRDGKIREGKFGLRTGLPTEGWR